MVQSSGGDAQLDALHTDWSVMRLLLLLLMMMMVMMMMMMMID